MSDGEAWTEQLAELRAARWPFMLLGALGGCATFAATVLRPGMEAVAR